MNTLINSIPTYVMTVVISTAIFFLIKFVQKLIHAQVAKAKTAQSKELWNFMDQVATVAVNSLVNSSLSGNDKFAQATTIVQQALDQQGITTVDVKAIEAAVQAAYEKSPLTSTDSQVKWMAPINEHEPVGPEGKAGNDGTAVASPSKDNVNDTQPVELK